MAELPGMIIMIYEAGEPRVGDITKLPWTPW